MKTNGVALPNNMTIEEYTERDIKRQSILGSVLMEGIFSVADAIRHLSHGRPENKSTIDAMREFLDSMVRDGLLKRACAPGKARWCRPGQPEGIAGPWRKTDNGVRLGMHQPPRGV